jgi:putative tricarboxylic transport membrane protein
VTFFQAAMSQPGYADIRQKYGLSPFTMTGEVLTEFVKKEVVRYRDLAQSLGLRVTAQ